MSGFFAPRAQVAIVGVQSVRPSFFLPVDRGHPGKSQSRIAIGMTGGTERKARFAKTSSGLGKHG